MKIVTLYSLEDRTIRPGESISTLVGKNREDNSWIPWLGYKHYLIHRSNLLQKIIVIPRVWCGNLALQLFNTDLYNTLNEWSKNRDYSLEQIVERYAYHIVKGTKICQVLIQDIGEQKDV